MNEVNPTLYNSAISSINEDVDFRLSVSYLHNSIADEDDRSSLTLWHQTSPLAKRKTNSFCGIFNRLLCTARRNTQKPVTDICLSSGNTSNSNGYLSTSLNAVHTHPAQRVPFIQHRRTPQEVYYESRGQSCRKLLKFNGNSNKVSSSHILIIFVFLMK